MMISRTNLALPAILVVLIGGAVFVPTQPSRTKSTAEQLTTQPRLPGATGAALRKHSVADVPQRDNDKPANMAGWVMPLLSLGVAAGLVAGLVAAPGTAGATTTEHPPLRGQPWQGSAIAGSLLAGMQKDDASGCSSNAASETFIGLGAGCLLSGMVIAEDTRLRRLVLPSGRFRSCGDAPANAVRNFRSRSFSGRGQGGLDVRAPSFLSKMDWASFPVAVSNANTPLPRRAGTGSVPSAAPGGGSEAELPEALEAIVGREHVRRNYTQRGSRLGQGTAIAHVSPGTLRQALDALKACVSADVAIVPQGANTSLTGASIARDDECDRPTVVINLRRLNKIMPIGHDAHQVLCFSGAGINDLKELLAEKHGRDSHSVLGSSFLNPSVGAGLAFGSGGTQIRKGPAWTERALYLSVSQIGEVEITDTLGFNDGVDSIEFLDGRDALGEGDLDPSCSRASSWPSYAKDLRQFDTQVARYNADITGPDCCRSEGKVMILASIHDTYPIVKDRLVWVSCKDYETAHSIKRNVALKSSDCMAKSCEYMNREVYNGVDTAGRILMKAIEVAGLSNVEPLWNLKLFIEALPLPFAGVICDKLLYALNGLLSHPLPQVVQDFGRDYDHHLLMEFGDYSDGEIDRLQAALENLAASMPDGHVRFYVCQNDERQQAIAWRFVVAPAFRTYCVGRGLQGLSIDYALPKSHTEYPTLEGNENPVRDRWVYSHFGCNVYHEDLAFGPEVDVGAAKLAVKRAVEGIRGRLPAEHGHGTEYVAPKEMQERWKRMDPLNVMNPGVGGTSYNRTYSPVARQKERLPLDVS